MSVPRVPPLAVMLSLIISASACDDSAASHWDWSRMRSQPRRAAYRGMLVPPEGTIPRESALDDSAASVPVNRERGKERYQKFCMLCHGDEQGHFASVGMNMAKPAPPLFVSDNASLSDGEVFEVMTHGRNRMQPFGADISARDRWQIVAYVQSIRPVSKATVLRR